MPLPGRKIRFLVDYSPHGRASVGPHYAKGEVYDLEISYAEKYKRLGKAEDAPNASDFASTSVEVDKNPASAAMEVVESAPEAVEQAVERQEQAQPNAHHQNRRGGRRG